MVAPDAVDIEQVIKQGVSASEKSGYLRHGLGGRLRRLTQENLQKALKFRGQNGLKQMSEKTRAYMNELVAEPFSHVGLRKFVEEKDKREHLLDAYQTMKKKRMYAGQRTPTSDSSALSLSRGALSTRRKPGLGLPGSGWFQRQREVLRREESAGA